MRYLSATSMGTRTRKSTALISLVLVPMNLLGLGFAGCDSRDDDANSQYSASDPVYNLDPVPNPTGGPVPGPVAYPATQPLASSGFVSGSHTGYHSHYYG